MNNKGKTYILIAAVLGIWGTVGYKIINGLGSDDPVTPKDDFKVSFKVNTEIETDTFSITALKRDPFLGTLTRRKSTTSSTPKRAGSTTTVPEIAITYNGLVKQQDTANQIFVVNINNNQCLLKRGQTAHGVTLVRGNAKTIVVRYGNTTKTLKRL